MRATKHAPRDPFRVLERRHGLKRLGAWECGWGPRDSRAAVQTYGPRLVTAASGLDVTPSMTAHVRARVQ